MKTTFLGQGFETNSTNAVGNHLMNFLNQKCFHTFTAISAFASEAGVYGLSSHIQSAKNNFKNLNLVVGIDQEGTSKEALYEILNLNINSYIFYQEEAPIFHPKMYLFEGDKDIKIIIGSSNLTGKGLFTNIESSILFEFGITDQDGLAILMQLKSYYKSLFDFSDPNLFVINNTTILDFIAKGIVPDESARRRVYNRKNSTTSTASPKTSNIAIPPRPTAHIPSSFLTKPRATSTGTRAGSSTANIATPASTVQPVNTQSSRVQPVQTRTLVWQKLSLSQSDAQQVPSGTAITGNLKLSQARFKVNNVVIDQTTYFRNRVFNNLTWVKPKPNNNSYEETLCRFDITILGNHIGTHTLKLSHDPARIAGQGNTPTWLHWGNALIPFLHQTNITNRTLNLYELNQSFFIEIV